ncbi:hypothetical protein HGRIS_000432 [Hohenbuehelia grisea]|uniref:Uncharacterized protein n=1 Tax=Hohenbuehelia grisea TaxID=104357 RepID=A0ABR3JRY7_9AGAR
MRLSLVPVAVLSAAAFVAGAAVPPQDAHLLPRERPWRPPTYSPSPPSVPPEMAALPDDVKERLGIPFYKGGEKPGWFERATEWLKNNILPREEVELEARERAWRPPTYSPSPPSVPANMAALPDDVKERLGIPFYKDGKPGWLERATKWLKNNILPREEVNLEARERPWRPPTYSPSPPSVPANMAALPDDVKERLGIPFYKNGEPGWFERATEWLKNVLPRDETASL